MKYCKEIIKRFKSLYRRNLAIKNKNIVDIFH